MSQNFDPNSVPADLRAHSQWVCWRSLPPKKLGGKRRKVPFQPNGEPAKTDNAGTWVTFEEALAAWRADAGIAGIGYVFSKDDPYAGIDLDESIKNGRLIPSAQAIVDAFATYTEISPSGEGVKLIVAASKPPGLTECAKRGVDGIARVEVYDTERFFTITGRRLEGTPATIADGQAELKALCDRLWPKRRTKRASGTPPTGGDHISMDARERRCRAYLEQCPDAISGDGGHDKTLRAACECVRFGLDDAAAWRVMCWFNDTKTGGETWTDKELDHKIKSAREKVTSEGEIGSRLGHDDVEPPPSFDGPMGLRLVATGSNRTPGKTTVRFDLHRHGRRLAEVQGSEKPTAQRHMGDAIGDELSRLGSPLNKEESRDVRCWVREVLSGASVSRIAAALNRRSQAARASAGPPAPPMLDIAIAFLNEAYDFRFIEGTGRGLVAWSETRGELVTQSEFVAQRDDELLKRLADASDYAAPTEADPGKPIRQLGLIMPVAWTALTKRLPREAGETGLGQDSRAAARFREHLDGLLLTPEAWTKESGGVGFDEPGSASRTTLAEKAAGFARGASAGTWHRVHRGVHVYAGRDGASGRVWMAIRYEACRYAIRSRAIPGTTDEAALNTLATRYGLAAARAEVPERLADEAEQRGLVVLSAAYTARVLAPDVAGRTTPDAGEVRHA